MELAHNFDIETIKTNGYTIYIWSQKWKAMKGPIVAIECVCKSVQHKYCTAIHLGQFSKS